MGDSHLFNKTSHVILALRLLSQCREQDDLWRFAFQFLFTPYCIRFWLAAVTNCHKGSDLMPDKVLSHSQKSEIHLRWCQPAVLSEGRLFSSCLPGLWLLPPSSCSLALALGFCHVTVCLPLLCQISASLLTDTWLNWGGPTRIIQGLSGFLTQMLPFRFWLLLLTGMFSRFICNWKCSKHQQTDLPRSIFSFVNGELCQSLRSAFADTMTLFLKQPYALPGSLRKFQFSFSTLDTMFLFSFWQSRWAGSEESLSF